MAVAEGDIVYLVFRGETGKLKVSGRVVAVEEDTLVVCGFPDKFGGLEEVVKGKAADSGRELCFVRVEQSAVSKQLPAGWNRDPVPKLAACKKVWAETGEIALSSEAEAPGSKQPSGSTEKPATSARAKSSLERDLFDLEGLWALSEESEEEEDETVEKAGNRGGKTRFLAPGASGRDSDRSKDRSRDKKGTDVMQAMLRQGLEAGQSPSGLMPLMMMGWMMNQGGKSRRHKHRKSKDWDLLGGSSSESSDDSGDQGMKAVSTLHKLHRRIKSRPRQVIHAFEQELLPELGEIQRNLQMCSDGCGGVRAAPFRPGGGRNGAARTELESQDAIRYPGRRLGHGLALDGHSRSSFSQRVRRQQARDGCGFWLRECPSKAPQASPRESFKQPQRRGGRGDLPKEVAALDGSLDVGMDGRSIGPGWHENSRFFLYYTWFQSAQGVLLERSGSDVPLFPGALPYPEVINAFVGGVSAEEEQVRWAKSYMNMVVGWSNFLALGCPDSGGVASEPRVGYRCLEEVRKFADELLGEVVEFAADDLRKGVLNCTGKRKLLEQSVHEAACIDAYGGRMAALVKAQACVALPVQAGRVAVPEHAGLVDPVALLPPDRARVVADLESLRLPEALWGEVVKACHRVPLEEETGLMLKLLETGMVTLLPEDQLPRSSTGDLMVGGLFCVAKNETEDRLILDRRPQNATMSRLVWAHLPAGACFCRMLLKDTEILRGSGDDLRNYYYSLRLPENWIKYNAVGRRVAPQLVQRFGKDPAIPHRACFRVLGMGDVNACDPGLRSASS